MTTVLIVDDEPDTVRMLSTGLGIFGLASLAAHSGQEAVRVFEENQPQAVVLDLMLPDMTGYDVARRLRALPGGATVPIVVVSATADTAAAQLCREAGANSFIRKPVNIRNLAEHIKELVEMS